MAKRRKGGASRSAQHDRNIAKVRQLADWVELAAKIVCWILFFAFAALQFSKEDANLLAEEPAPELIFRVAMILYLTSWSFGAVHDLRDQRDALIAPVNDGKRAWTGFAVIVALGGLFALMCYLRSRDKLYFAVALGAFLIFNIIGWRHYVKRFMRPMIEKSLSRYAGERDYFAVEKVKNVEKFICGDWQIVRFAIAIVLAAIVGVVLYPGVSTDLAGHIPGTKGPEIESLAMLAYVVIIEGIIWHRRIRSRMGRMLLDEMELDYTLIKRP